MYFVAGGGEWCVCVCVCVCVCSPISSVYKNDLCVERTITKAQLTTDPFLSLPFAGEV